MSHLFAELLVLMLSYLLSSFFNYTPHSTSSRYEVRWHRSFTGIKAKELYQKEWDYSTISKKIFGGICPLCGIPHRGSAKRNSTGQAFHGAGAGIAQSRFSGTGWKLVVPEVCRVLGGIKKQINSNKVKVQRSAISHQQNQEGKPAAYRITILLR